MRLTFLADLRSPIAVQWIRHFVDRGYPVQAISSHPVPRGVIPGADTATLPLVLPGQRQNPGRPGPERAGRPSTMGLAAHWATPQRVAAIRSLCGPVAVRAKRRRLQRLVDQHRPDLVHAMRMPFEGIAAGRLIDRPLVISIWGNDFTLFADRTPMMARATRQALAAADALHCDCNRDARLAGSWGFPDGRTLWVLPGNGGIDRSVFYPARGVLHSLLGIPEQARIILNPRGIREYVRNDIFFRALPAVFESCPDSHVICTGMAGSRYAEDLIAEARLDRSRIHLLPVLEHHVMADAFRSSCVSVSLSEHDGTPNTLLESMACGTLPVAGDIASVREWIQDGINGILVSPRDPTVVATAITRALSDHGLASLAHRENQRLVRERADYHKNMTEMESRYEELVKVNSGPRVYTEIIRSPE